MGGTGWKWGSGQQREVRVLLPWLPLSDARGWPRPLARGLLFLILSRWPLHTAVNCRCGTSFWNSSLSLPVGLGWKGFPMALPLTGPHLYETLLKLFGMRAPSFLLGF